jgi:hypothetical protein
VRRPSNISILTTTALLAAALFVVLRQPTDPIHTRTAVDCSGPEAVWGVVVALRPATNAEHDASDGAGRAWIDPSASSESITVGAAGRWVIVFEAGPLGIDDGGAIIFLVSPFWGWSSPQTFDDRQIGFTRVTTDAQVELVTSVNEPPMMGISLRGGRLKAGEQVRIEYGAGPAGARADRFAERGSRFWIGVDGDGDGTHSFLADSPSIDVSAGPPALLLLTLPSTAHPGDPVRLNLALVDRSANADPSISRDDLQGEVLLESSPAWPGLPDRIRFRDSDRGHRSIDISAPTEGVYRIRASALGKFSAQSNPLVVFPNVSFIWWGDLHGHSNLSDGTGTPEDYFRYARDIAALDVAALTDHDHWGTLPLDSNPGMWDEIQREARAFHQPGRFITLLGYEWTSWIHGHRHVLYFVDQGEVYSSIDPKFESPLQLWDALRGQPALTFAHHSAGGPIATNWNIPPDPELEPVTEVVSVHGVSEAEDSPARIYRPVPGNFIRDALDRGYLLGFVGSGDSHDGHPGLAQIASGTTGGLVAFFAEELSREAILDALRRRRVYATSGARIYLRVSLQGHPMGSAVTGFGSPAADTDPLPAEARLRIHVVGTDEIESVDVIRSGAAVERVPVDGSETELAAEVLEFGSGEYLYVRVIQEDGAMAWSSPIFAR